MWGWRTSLNVFVGVFLAVAALHAIIWAVASLVLTPLIYWSSR